MLDNQDELNIAVGLVGFEDVEATLARLETILERARRSADRVFKAPSSSAEEFAAHVTNLERKVVSLTGSFAGIGKLGAQGFEKLNKAQIDAFERLTYLQRQLQQIDKELQKSAKPSTLVKLKKEAVEAEKEIASLEKTLLALKPLDIIQKKYAADSPKPTVAKPDFLMDRAIRDIERMKSVRAGLERDLTKQIDFETDKQYRIRTSAFQRGLNNLLKGYRTLQQQEAKLTEKQQGGRGPLEAGLSKLGLGGLAGGLGPAAAIVAVGFALQRVYGIAEKAIERASEQARANRTLASSAAEAGVSIDFLTKKNKEFAELTGLSDVKATATVAKITQLATLAQTPNRLEDFIGENGKKRPGLLKAFADLGAARGLDATGIETVVQQIITGQDEGYKKLLLPNPALLQAKYAKANNRSVTSLTSVEKAQIFQEEFLKKAELFNGAAEARLASVDGKAAKLTASFENLANNLSTKFANNYDITNFIEGLTQAFNGLNTEISDLANKVERGINVDDLIKQQSGPGILGYAQFAGNTLLSGAATLFSGGGALYKTGYGKELAATASERANAALANVNPDLRADFERQRINAEIRTRAINRKVEEERKVQLASEKAIEERDKFKAKEQKRLLDIFENPESTAYEVIKGLEDIKSYQQPLAKTLNQNAIDEEVVKRFSSRNTDLDRGQTQDQITGKIREQVTKEFQASLDVQNLPLFSEEDKKAAYERGIKVLDQLAKKARELVQGVREDLVNTLADKEDNPFVKLLNNVESAAEAARLKFARLGASVADAMGKIAEEAARQKLAVAEFESSDRELKFRQQARRLEQLPDNQTNAFERRLQRVETEAAFRISSNDTRRQIDESSYFSSTTATGKARKLREAFLRAQYGESGYADLVSGARGTREEKDAYREIGVKIKDAQTDVSALRSLDLQGVGLYGRGAIAEQLLGRLPTTQELLPRLRGEGRGREEALGLFRTRSELLKDKQSADQQKFNDFIQNQKFIDLNRKDAIEQAANLEKAGTGLSAKDKLDKFLAITQELGNAELTPELRQQRIKALNARADIEATEKKTAADQLKTISDFVSTLNKNIVNGGLKVVLSDTPIVNVAVNAAGVTAALESRPTSQR